MYLKMGEQFIALARSKHGTVFFHGVKHLHKDAHVKGRAAGKIVAAGSRKKQKAK